MERRDGVSRAVKRQVADAFGRGSTPQSSPRAVQVALLPRTPFGTQIDVLFIIPRSFKASQSRALAKIFRQGVGQLDEACRGDLRGALDARSPLGVGLTRGHHR